MPKDIKNAPTYYSNDRNDVYRYLPLEINKMLDVGCGEGTFAYSIKKNKNAEVWGIELIEDIAHKAEKLIDKVLIGDINNLIDKLPDNYFDCITFNDVLEHIIDPTVILEKIKNKLTPNGLILCSIPSVRNIVNLYHLIFKKDWKYSDEGVLDYTHLRFYTMKSGSRMFIENKFNIINVVGINPIETSKKQKIIYRLLNIITFGLFSDTIYRQFLWILKK